METSFFTLSSLQDPSALSAALENTFPFPFAIVVQYFWKFAANVNGEKLKYQTNDQWTNSETTNIYTIRVSKVKNKVPLIFRPLFGAVEYIFCEERIVYDPNNKTLRIQNTNRDFQSYFTIVDQREYRLHPANPNWTLFLQNGTISVSSKCNLFQYNVRNYILKQFKKFSEEAYQDFVSFLGTKKKKLKQAKKQ